MISLYTFRTLPFPAMISLLVKVLPASKAMQISLLLNYFLQHRQKMSTSPKLSYSSMGTTSSTSPSLTTSSSSPTSTSSATSQQHKKFRPPYTRPSHRAARYIPKPMPQELGHLKTYSKNYFNLNKFQYFPPLPSNMSCLVFTRIKKKSQNFKHI